MNKKRMVSGIKPSGKLTLGNYLGAIKPFIKYQDEYEMYIFIADLHALTLPITKKELKENTLDLICTYLSSGLDPEKVTLFKQSDIPAHNQLEWILTCTTNVSDLTKMPQYKNYLENNKDEATPLGMLMYPSLMNADILLYDAEVVPTGLDQKPHVDLTRDIAEKFNRKYENSFTIPDSLITKTGCKIMSLSNPLKKMSKSESDKGTIYLSDDINVIRSKIKKAVTDAESKIYYDPINKPGISNLLTIYAACKNIDIKEAEDIFKDEKDYGIFKNKVADTVCDEISQLQEKIKLIKESESLDNILKIGADKANLLANRKINKIYRKIGLR